jgi:hypothetical protein
MVVNPFLIYNKGHPTKPWKDDSNTFAGWCVFDSTAWTEAEQPQAKESGLILTTQSHYNASYGIRFFLNFCASYLYSKDDPQNKGKQKH